MVQKGREVRRKRAASSNLLGQGCQPLHGLRANLVRFVANIEREADFAGNHVAGSWMNLDGANGRDEARDAAGLRLDCDHPFGGGGKSVVARVHRSGAGMIRMSDERNRQARLADDGFDGSEGQIEAFEDRPLFDVKFEIGKDIVTNLCKWKLGWVEAEILDCLADRDAIGISPIKEVLVVIADEGTATNERRGKANAFFFGEGDKFDGERQELAVKLFKKRDGKKNSERAIEGAGIWHGVQ